MTVPVRSSCQRSAQPLPALISKWAIYGKGTIQSSWRTTHNNQSLRSIGWQGKGEKEKMGLSVREGNITLTPSSKPKWEKVEFRSMLTTTNITRPLLG